MSKLVGNLLVAGGGQIKNFIPEVLATDPVSPLTYQMWINSTTGELKLYTGTSTIVIATGGSTEELQELVDEVIASVGLNADGTLPAFTDTDYISSSENVRAALIALDEALKDVADAAATQTEVDAIETGAGLETDGSYVAPTGSNYLGSATSLKNADTLLDAQVKLNADAIGENTTAIGNLQNDKVNKSGDTMTGNLAFGGSFTVTGLAAPINGTDAARKVDIDNAISGLDIQGNIIGFEADFVDVAGRYIYTDGSKFVAGATGASANDIVDVDTDGNVLAVSYDVSVAGPGALVWNEAGTTWLNWNGSSWDEFGAFAGFTAGVGIDYTGGVVSVKMGAGIGQLPTNEVGIDIRANSGLFLTEDGVTPSTGTDAQLAILLNGGTLALGASGLSVADAGITETQLAASVAGAGLTGGAGSALSVGSGTGITVNADSIEFDTTWGDARYALSTDLGDLETAVSNLSTRLNDSQFVYDGSVSSDTHVVNHNLGQQYPQVLIVDSSDNKIEADAIVFNTANQLTVTFTSAITCKVIVFAPKVVI